jgi:hypothetical protein
MRAIDARAAPVVWRAVARAVEVRSLPVRAGRGAAAR